MPGITSINIVKLTFARFTLDVFTMFFPISQKVFEDAQVLQP